LVLEYFKPEKPSAFICCDEQSKLDTITFHWIGFTGTPFAPDREREWSTSKNNLIILDTLVASVMPSISPVHSLSGEDEEERGDQIRKIVSARKSRSPGSTFSERLKAARKLIPSYPGRAKLVRSVSESSGLTLTTNDQRIHSKAETESCATIQDFGTFFREHAIIMEL